MIAVDMGSMTHLSVETWPTSKSECLKVDRLSRKSSDAEVASGAHDPTNQESLQATPAWPPQRGRGPPVRGGGDRENTRWKTMFRRGRHTLQFRSVASEDERNSQRCENRSLLPLARGA